MNYPRGSQQPMQTGTVTTDAFAKGQPWYGHRAYGHRTGPVRTMKPLPESIITSLLEDDLPAEDDPALGASGMLKDDHCKQISQLLQAELYA